MINIRHSIFFLLFASLCVFSAAYAENGSDTEEENLWPPEAVSESPVIEVVSPVPPRERTKEGYLPGGEQTPVTGSSSQDSASHQEEEIAPDIFAPKDSSSFINIDPDPFAEADFAESPDFMVVGAEEPGSQPIDEFDSFVPLGISYRGKAYPSEEAASEDYLSRDLGTPYLIRSPIQEKARRQGY